MTNPVQELIEREINEHDVVLFMKGTPVFPKCVFSNLVVQVLSHLPIGLLELNRGTDEGRQFIYGQAHVRGGEPDRGGKN